MLNVWEHLGLILTRWHLLRKLFLAGEMGTKFPQIARPVSGIKLARALNSRPVGTNELTWKGARRFKKNVCADEKRTDAAFND